MNGPETVQDPMGHHGFSNVLMRLQSNRNGQIAIKIGFVPYIETVILKCLDVKGKMYLHLRPKINFRL